MQRIERRRPSGIFRGTELPRLLTMIVMLGVLLLLISRARDPSTWTWLINEAGDGKTAADVTPRRDDATNSGSQRPSAAVPEKPAPTGPTDEDREEAEAIEEEFQAVSDGSLSIRPEEMPAYKRLWRWAGNQPFSRLRGRARTDLTFTDLYQTPERYRGQLVALDLNVRRILQDQLDGIPLYEVWGWTTESKAWPYVAVVMDLPEGMKTGAAVEEEAAVVGYFFKLQGYHEAGAAPNAQPLRAPLLVGRLVWHPDRVPQAQSTDWTWGFLLMLGFLLIVILRWGLVFVKEKRRAVLPQRSDVSTFGRTSLEDWLAQPEASEAADDTTGETDPEAHPDPESEERPGNGRSSGSPGLFHDGLDGGRPGSG